MPLTTHSRLIGDSATLGARTRSQDAGVTPASSNSSTERPTSALEAFTAWRRSQVARLTTNSPVSRAFFTESFSPPSTCRPLAQYITIGGCSWIALKKLNGARFRMPAASTVEIQPIGRGTTQALNGLPGKAE